MRILMYADQLGGNTTTFIHNEIDYLSKKHDLLFVCNMQITTGSFQYSNVKKIDYVPSLSHKVLNKLKISMTFKNETFANELNKTINEFKPEVIHCHFGIQALKIVDNIKDKTIPIFVHFHGFDASAMLKNKLYVKRLKKVLVQSNIHSLFVAEYLKSNLEQEKIKIGNSTLLHCGIDLSKFNDWSVNEEKSTGPVFLQVSSLVEKKGHEYTLKAFAKFLKNNKTSNSSLILTGDGERKEMLVELVNELGLENHVEFVGFVTPTEAVSLMKKADVFLHHSITAENGDQEGIPTAIMEAMAMGLPIITTNHSGIPELVKDNIHGYLVDEKDVNSYSEKMSDILTWTKQEINRKVIDDEFELVKHNQKLEELYQNIVNKR